MKHSQFDHLPGCILLRDAETGLAGHSGRAPPASSRTLHLQVYDFTCLYSMFGRQLPVVTFADSRGPVGFHYLSTFQRPLSSG